MGGGAAAAAAVGGCRIGRNRVLPAVLMGLLLVASCTHALSTALEVMAESEARAGVTCPLNCSGHGKCESSKLGVSKTCKKQPNTTNQGKVLFDGEASNTVITGAKSDFQTGGYFDRTWAYNTCSLERGVEYDKCAWTLGNSYQMVQEDATPSSIPNGFIAGFDSEFSAAQKDRIWKIKFCNSQKIQLKNCAYLGYWLPSTAGTNFDFKCEEGKVWGGAKSQWDAATGDRQWDVMCCTAILAGCNCQKGFGGNGCEKPKCEGTPECSGPGQGTCSMTSTGGFCICKAGYWGPSCKYKVCPGKVGKDQFCNKHGDCDKTKGECICKPGWAGASCSWPHVGYSSRSISSSRSKLLAKETPCHDLGGSGTTHKASRWKNDHCYIHFTDTKSFGGARRHCEKLGGYVVAITSDAEAGFIQGTFGSGFKKGYDVWLGLSNEMSPSAWEWINGEIAVEGDNSLYGNWQKAPTRDGGLRCAVMNNDNEYKWRVEACSNMCQFICEVPNIPTGYKPISPKIPGFAKKFKDHVNASVSKQRKLLSPLEKDVGYVLADVRAFSDQATRSEDSAARLHTEVMMAMGDMKMMKRKSQISTSYWASMRKMIASLVMMVDSTKNRYESIFNKALETLERMSSMMGLVVERCKKLSVRVDGDGGGINSITELLVTLAKQNRKVQSDITSQDNMIREKMDKMENMFPKYLAVVREQRDRMSMELMESKGFNEKETTSIKASLKKRSEDLKYKITAINSGMRNLQDDMERVEASIQEAMGMQCNCIRGKMVDYIASQNGWQWHYGSDGNWRTRIGGEDDATQGLLCKCFGNQEDTFTFSSSGISAQLALVMSKEESGKGGG